MVVRVSQAVKEALDEIQEKGYVVIPSSENDSISIIWIGDEAPPDIASQVAVLETDPDVLGAALTCRTVPVPLWLILGYPWDRPPQYWTDIKKSLHQPMGTLDKIKYAYAKSCLLFYRDKQNPLWKELIWEEPWPIVGEA